MTAIYSLHDPVSGDVRYIGKTHHPLHKRLKSHLRETRRPDRAHGRKNRWINSLILQGLMPRICLVEQVPIGKDWEEYEKLWIAKYRALLAGTLLNHMSGGQNGPPKGCAKSPETRQKIAASLTGRKSTRVGYKHSPSTLQKMAEARKGRRLSPEHRRNLTLARLGKKRTPEQRQKMSEIAKRRVATEAGRKQLEAAIIARHAARIKS
jgi:NUMOD3 motif